MARHRDVEAFDERSNSYESGWRGRLHHLIASRTADLALACTPSPMRILDVGCGTGFLLRQLATRLPNAIELVGVDPARGMVEVARTAAPDDPRLRFLSGVAERLPFPDEAFDLVVSTTSFDHWADQQGGLVECARVLTPVGYLVLTDLFSAALLPTLLFGHRGHARTKRRAGELLNAAGFASLTWHTNQGFILRTVTGTR